MKILYWIVTGLLCLLLMFSAGMYFTQYEMIKGVFEGFGYPSAIVYPLAIAKILAIIAIVTKKSTILKELAYLGLLIDFVLAIKAHLDVADGEHMAAVVALILLVLSYILDKMVFRSNKIA